LLAFSDDPTLSRFQRRPLNRLWRLARFALNGRASTQQYQGFHLIIPMNYIEPHAHMVSRVTDDYIKLKLAGCQAVCEPAFWAGFDRSSQPDFMITSVSSPSMNLRELPKFGLPHFCWLCINPKEAEDVKLAEDVLALIPGFLHADNVLGIVKSA